MARDVLLVGRRDPAGEAETDIICSPGVGLFYGAPAVGSHVASGSRMGVLRILNREYELHLPPGHSGCVVRVAVQDRVEAVAFGQELLALGASADTFASQHPTGISGKGDTALLEGGRFAVRAPTDGIFYRRPNPESPPFVDVGSSVVTGSTLGLVEVMKCFNYITCTGEGCPASGVVERILADDVSEVHIGQTLFLIRPA